MVSLFKAKTTIGVFRLILLSVVVHIKFFIQSPVVIPLPEHILLAPILDFLVDWPTLVLGTLYHALVVIQALRLNYILGNNKLFAQTNFTVAMCYILFTGLLPAWCNISGALIINTLIIWLIHLLCKLYNSNKPGATIFNIALLTGICILLYPGCYPLICIMFAGILIIRPFKFSQVLTYFIGALLPLYFLMAYLYLNDNLNHLFAFLPKLGWHMPNWDDKATLIGSFSLIGICLIGGFSYVQANMQKLLIIARKCWIIIFIMLLCLVPTIFTFKDTDWHLTILVMPAAAAIAGNLFYYNQNKVFLSVLFWLLIFSAWFYSFDGWQLLAHK